MRILITGGAGYVGGFLTDHLTAAGYNVTVYDNLTYEDRYLKDVPFVFGDIRDKDKLKPLLCAHDIVVHLAAIVGDGACAIDPGLTQAINEDATRWISENFDGKIIYASTCSVYGINNDLINEDAMTYPLSAYASTKLAGEFHIIKNAEDYLIFRLGTLFGLGDQHSRIRLDLVANIMTKRAIAGERLKVFGGDQWRPLLHVRDVSTAILHGIENNLSGRFNLSMINWRIRDIAEHIANIVPGTGIDYQDLKFEDMRNYRVSSDKFLETGWRPRHYFDDGIAEVAKVIQEKRIKNTSDLVYSNVDYLRQEWKS